MTQLAFDLLLGATGFYAVMYALRVATAIHIDQLLTSTTIRPEAISLAREKSPFYERTITPLFLASDALRLFGLLIPGFVTAAIALRGVQGLFGSSVAGSFFVTVFVLTGASAAYLASQYTGTQPVFTAYPSERKRGFRIIVQISMLILVCATLIAQRILSGDNTQPQRLVAVTTLGGVVALFTGLFLAGTYYSKHFRRSTDDTKAIRGPGKPIPTIRFNFPDILKEVSWKKGIKVFALSTVITISLPIAFHLALLMNPDQSFAGNYLHTETIVVGATSLVAASGIFLICRIASPVVSTVLNSLTMPTVRSVVRFIVVGLVGYLAIHQIPNSAVMWASLAWLLLIIPFSAWISTDSGTHRETWLYVSSRLTAAASAFPLLLGLMIGNTNIMRLSLSIAIIAVSAFFTGKA